MAQFTVYNQGSAVTFCTDGSMLYSARTIISVGKAKKILQLSAKDVNKLRTIAKNDKILIKNQYFARHVMEELSNV